MKRKNVEDALQKGPYSEPRQITVEQINYIQERVLRRGRQQPFVHVKRVIPFMLSLAILAVIAWVSLPIEQQSTPMASIPPSDEQILQLIQMNETDPDMMPKIMYKEELNDNQMLIFTNTVKHADSIMIWEAGVLQWDEHGMAWVVEGKVKVPLGTELENESLNAEGINEVFSYTFVQLADQTPSLEPSSYLLAFGASVDPDVHSIWFTDESKQAYTAKMIPYVYEGYTLWFTPLPGQNEFSYQLHAVDGESVSEPIDTNDHKIPLYRRLDMSNIAPEDIHIPLNLADNQTDENPVIKLLNTSAKIDSPEGILIEAAYLLRDGVSEFWISQFSGQQGDPDQVLEDLKLEFPTETLTETMINGHKALIEQSEARGQIFIVTENYFYAVNSVYSVDIDVLLSAAKQIKIR
ncbi:hypothetical protein ACX93W_22045 [Paenibacillus sp. CAU 1782]